MEAHLSQSFNWEMYIVLTIFLMAVGVAGWTVWWFVKMAWKEIWN